MASEHVDMDALEGVLRGLDEAPTPPFRLTRLDGGYSWRTYRVVGRKDRAVILRLAPEGGTMEPYDPAVEARAIVAAVGCVPAPEVLLVERSAKRLGAPFSVQAELAGSTVRPTDEVRDGDRHLYQEAFATALGRIHALPTDSSATITEALRSELETSYDHYLRTTPWVHPGFEIGYRWLRTRVPESDDLAVLCHGDFRLANLLWEGPGELTGVLDWERAWLGDPMADVAFTRLFSGWCSVSGEASTTYAREAGFAVDEARVEYALRFERWRSFTSSTRGLRAFLDGRNDDPRLLAIGLAGDAGAWDLVEWLEPGLAPLEDDRLPATGAPYLPTDWFAQHAPALLVRLTTADERSRATSLDALRSEEVSAPGLTDEILVGDPASAWDRAFGVLAEAARRGGADLVPAMKAMALRAQGRPKLRAAELRPGREVSSENQGAE